jgi:hypothetical protein
LLGFGFTVLCKFEALFGPAIHIVGLVPMFRDISPKALIVSNIAHWCLIVLSVIIVAVLYSAAATIASDGTLGMATILADMKSSPTVLYAGAFASAVATMPAGYIAAKLAPRAKLLNGALSTSSWFLICAYDAIWGTAENSKIDVPFWFDLLASFSLLLSAVAGAYVWQMRANARHLSARVETQAPLVLHQIEKTPPPAASARAQMPRRTHAATGLGLFVVLLSNILLTKHEQNIMFVGSLLLLAVLLVAAFVAKALKTPRRRT